MGPEHHLTYGVGGIAAYRQMGHGGLVYLFIPVYIYSREVCAQKAS